MPSFYCKGCRVSISASSPVKECPACGATVSQLPQPTEVWRSKRGRRRLFDPMPKGEPRNRVD